MGDNYYLPNVVCTRGEGAEAGGLPSSSLLPSRPKGRHPRGAGVRARCGRVPAAPLGVTRGGLGGGAEAGRPA
jgi:hypothetical protein